MGEKPILFSGPMVRAILEGRKTQTRRVVKPQPHPKFIERGVVGVVPQWPHQDGVRWFMADGCSELVKSTYGAPGDTLWVRETWAYNQDALSDTVRYAADGAVRDPDECKRLRPSIHMPRWASRITLEITGVRVERVQEITGGDAIAEGIESFDLPGNPMVWRDYFQKQRDEFEWFADPSESYRTLWDSLNAKRGYGWAMNPWVWVITFKKL